MAGTTLPLDSLLAGALREARRCGAHVFNALALGETTRELLLSLGFARGDGDTFVYVEGVGPDGRRPSDESVASVGSPDPAAPTDKLAEIKRRVASLIRSEEHPVVIFSKTSCPFCKTAKALFQKLGHDIFALELDVSEEGSAMQQVLLELTSQRTVPNIFVRGKHIGGNDKAHSLAASGELQRLLGMGTPPQAQRSEEGKPNSVLLPTTIAPGDVTWLPT